MSSPSATLSNKHKNHPHPHNRRRYRRKNKSMVVVEFPKEWGNTNGANNNNNIDYYDYPLENRPDWDCPDNLQYENQDHPPSSSPFGGCIPPFVLGFLVATILIVIPTMASIYWTCSHSNTRRDGGRKTMMMVSPPPPLPSPSPPQLESSMSPSSNCSNITLIARSLQQCQEAGTATSTNNNNNNNKKRNILQRIFQRRQKRRQFEHESIASLGLLSSSTTTTTVKTLAQDPIECACQLFWQGLQQLGIDFMVTDETNATNDACETNAYRSDFPTFQAQYEKAFSTSNIPLTLLQKELMIELNNRVHALIPDFDHRAALVSWGGSGSGSGSGRSRSGPQGSDWYVPRLADAQTDLEQMDGGSLYYSYLCIMKWPANLWSHFPFKLCAKGCSSEIAIQHSLEFRERYQPWIISPSMLEENAHGFVYHHGFSPSKNGDPNGLQHSLMWARPGLRKNTKPDDVAFTRAIIHTFDRAIAASLERSKGRVGKVNVVIDGTGLSWSLIPSLRQTKIIITILQDHYPDRLGIVLLSNIGRVGELLLNLFMPLITEEVRHKLKILPRDPLHRRHVLETILGVTNIPTWLGGTDPYAFRMDEYYENEQLKRTEDDARGYLTTMPYHA